MVPVLAQTTYPKFYTNPFLGGYLTITFFAVSAVNGTQAFFFVLVFVLFFFFCIDKLK